MLSSKAMDSQDEITRVAADPCDGETQPVLKSLSIPPHSAVLLGAGISCNKSSGELVSSRQPDQRCEVAPVTTLGQASGQADEDRSVQSPFLWESLPQWLAAPDCLKLIDDACYYEVSVAGVLGTSYAKTLLQVRDQRLIVAKNLQRPESLNDEDVCDEVEGKFNDGDEVVRVDGRDASPDVLLQMLPSEGEVCIKLRRKVPRVVPLSAFCGPAVLLLSQVSVMRLFLVLFIPLLSARTATCVGDIAVYPSWLWAIYATVLIMKLVVLFKTMQYLMPVMAWKVGYFPGIVVGEVMPLQFLGISAFTVLQTLADSFMDAASTGTISLLSSCSKQSGNVEEPNDLQVLEILNYVLWIFLVAQILVPWFQSAPTQWPSFEIGFEDGNEIRWESLQRKFFWKCMGINVWQTSYADALPNMAQAAGLDPVAKLYSKCIRSEIDKILESGGPEAVLRALRRTILMTKAAVLELLTHCFLEGQLQLCIQVMVLSSAVQADLLGAQGTQHIQRARWSTLQPLLSICSSLVSILIQLISVTSHCWSFHWAVIPKVQEVLLPKVQDVLDADMCARLTRPDAEGHDVQSQESELEKELGHYRREQCMLGTLVISGIAAMMFSTWLLIRLGMQCQLELGSVRTCMDL
eukprot:TRINITY_DN7629_c0_g1_i1.p1 TRINITY_DN7629_c0_g1~~TRINITY_DN7629_c0_g1_i1.p1  ORF type:complete len:635 (-),score=94.67 TRINITY_DN7629_c0_g1_i1:311-2215(-)